MVTYLSIVHGLGCLTSLASAHGFLYARVGTCTSSKSLVSRYESLSRLNQRACTLIAQPEVGSNRPHPLLETDWTTLDLTWDEFGSLAEMYPLPLGTFGKTMCTWSTCKYQTSDSRYQSFSDLWQEAEVITSEENTGSCCFPIVDFPQKQFPLMWWSFGVFCWTRVHLRGH